MTPIAIPAEVLASIYDHALEQFPAECCGCLTGPAGGDHVDTAIAWRNAQLEGPETSFVVGGSELLAFARSFDTEAPARIVYHSHTNGRAYFSSVDQQMAAGPTYPVQHLVIGVASGFAGPVVTEVAQFAWSETERTHVEVARWEP